MFCGIIFGDIVDHHWNSFITFFYQYSGFQFCTKQKDQQVLLKLFVFI